ncbi:hypothetical protein C7974DRAFT_456311 [Boeremia exigua]|uniref:uncharacterized protein n=1 Tax=Boeremia exigua TaxID=749465 RepID=UPI001E8CC1E6|nr:uncharacterized protein C7974DRAFT_456311 [Boeremia exigua]KAH6625915.1 hypothetical protein C7974DRAFT_456311 [Boeremia exigua]
MTVPRGTPHASQTAPVAEFRCLYTADVRKKQKKWQDGFLKFHAFNSRVMVYDHARNFLGDTYYKDRDALAEGDELTLDKGVLVEVADALGVTQTDLAPLFERRPQGVAGASSASGVPSVPRVPLGAPLSVPPSAPRRFQPPSHVARPAASSAVRPSVSHVTRPPPIAPAVRPPTAATPAARPPPTTATTTASTATATTTPRTAQQLRHKSLNTLLGTPKGPIGKSVPITSPYEARQEQQREKENDFAVDRAAKRQKTTHRPTTSVTSPVAPATTSTTRLSSPVQESPVPRKILPPPVRTSTMSAKAPAVSARKPARPLPHDTPVVILDEPDAVAPPSSDPSLPDTSPDVSRTPSRPATPPPVRPVVAAKQTPRIPRGRVPVPSVKALETPRAPAPPSSPPVSASNRLTNVDFAVQPTPIKAPAKGAKQPSPLPSLEPPKSPPRNPKAKSLRLSKGVKRGTLMICQPTPALPPSRHSSEARVLAKKPSVARRSNTPNRRSPTPPAVQDTSTASIASKAKRRAGRDTVECARLSEVSLDEFDDDQELMHGLMDQQLLVSAIPPEPIAIPSSPEVVLSRPKAAKAVPTTRKTAPRKARESASVKTPPPPPTRSNKPVQNPQVIRDPSPPAAMNAEAADVQSRAASPALSVLSDSRSRTASLSPRKLAALSTGGFRRNPKSATPQPILAPAQRNETVALPPHPLRANKKGPLMTTTELAAMLQQPKKKRRAPADPIEDEGETAETSPNRKFRRVRSENDAPIPSTSEDWEKRNAPKAPLAATETLIADTAVPKKRSGLAALIKKTDPRKKFVRTQSLTVETTLPPAHATESPMVSPVVDKDIGPWSTEAFDLFDWRPPGREELGA